ncbi:hypothetical protein FJV41_04085 [Myxococcus llanfairpwllgwyngyllgogerychwyrndrobwllllantysiliogogogochensis]|uniref:Uncharacterized protein n=1 Tax=Myxococcus llanfairpwllgwyngyllgogerychwyrndrobwllllantysiliogogogochensis TaxID=2590453 RepID=A0A540X7T2_9BACT|nr:hypothetical protein [Myxococcus llanfairpwllgwyngyllgogerychwyrndrobwllllantysiliogogogochensis]TQF17229.1 hypothetical protein FJV41_04085 [Myxococcus llanfairpwllgwyngyllgogerychwyrndrobwllllantysiliogogogochensis]
MTDQAEQLQEDASARSEQSSSVMGAPAKAGEPRRAQSSRSKRSPARRGGRPASNPHRQARTYRDKLRAAGADVAAICEANAWARAHDVPVDGAAELVELHSRERAAPAAPPPPSAPPPSAPPPPAPAEPEQGPELVDPVDPSVFDRPLGDAAHDDPSDDGEPDPGHAGPRPPPQPTDPTHPTYMGEPPELVEACARGPLFVLGALAELTRGGLLDLTRPVERTLFAGTPFARDVRADPVTRLSELAGVGIARRVQAAAASAATDGGVAHPSVAWELVPLGLAFAGAVALPNVGLVSGAAKSVGGWLLRGAQGAAGGLGRLFSRGRS